MTHEEMLFQLEKSSIRSSTKVTVAAFFHLSELSQYARLPLKESICTEATRLANELSLKALSRELTH